MVSICFEYFVLCGMAEVCINQENALAALRHGNTEIASKGALAISGFGRGDLNCSRLF